MKDLKELRALLKLLRQNGVLTYKSSELDLTLSPDSHLLSKQKETQIVEVDPNNPWAQFPTGELSPEQLAFYSAGGMPGEEDEVEVIPQ